MKNLMYLSFLVVFITASSCIYETKKSTNMCCLSREDSLAIINEIIETTDAYSEANNKIDVDKCAEFWDSSSDLLFAETGKEYTNWDSIYNDIKKWYSQPLDSVKFTWEERKINPLNRNAATLYSKALFRAKFKSGLIYESKVNIGILLTKKNDKWKTTIGYWAIKVTD